NGVVRLPAGFTPPRLSATRSLSNPMTAGWERRMEEPAPGRRNRPVTMLLPRRVAPPPKMATVRKPGAAAPAGVHVMNYDPISPLPPVRHDPDARRYHLTVGDAVAVMD